MHGLFHVRLSLMVPWLLTSGWLFAAEHGDAVDLFDAVDDGQVSVKFIPVDREKANVLITNRTDAMLHIALPEAIAAVPVLAQFAQDFGQNQGGGGANGPLTLVFFLLAGAWCRIFRRRLWTLKTGGL